MNNIHKVIWSHCSNAFVVVSELAHSRSSGGNTRSKTRSGVAHLAVSSPLTTLAAGIALAFGLSAPAWAMIEDDLPGGSVLEIGAPGDAPWVSGTEVKNTGYGNALQINNDTVDLNIKGGGTFSVKPTGPRNPGDTAPYAAILIKRINGKTFFEHEYDFVNNVPKIFTAKVEGDNLHGVHVESGAWVQMYSVEIDAKGDNNIGLHSEGFIDLRGIKVDVAGANAKGIHIGAGTTIASFTEVKASGSNAIGIDVAGGFLRAPSTHGSESMNVEVIGAANSDATGIRFDGGGIEHWDGQNWVGYAESVVVDVSNVDGNKTTGILLNTLLNADKSITFDTAPSPGVSNPTAIKVVGGTDPNSTTTGIEVGEGLTAKLIDASIEVEAGGGEISGIYLRGNGSAVMLDESEITLGSSGYGLHLKADSTATLINTAINLNDQTGTAIKAENSTVTVDGGAIKGLILTAGAKKGVDAEQNSIVGISETDIIFAGEGSIGVNATSASSVTLDSVEMHITGDRSTGLDVSDSATANITGGTTIMIMGNMDGGSSAGIHLSSLGSLTTDDATINVNSAWTAGEAYGVRSLTGIAELTNTDIFAASTGNLGSGMAYGIKSSDSAKTKLNNVMLDIEGENQAFGVEVFNTSELNTSNGTSITAKSDSGTARGVYANDHAKVTLIDTDIDVEGRVAVAVDAGDNSELTVSGGSIRAESSSGSEAVGISASGASDVVLIGADVEAFGIKTIGVQLSGDGTTLSAEGGTRLSSAAEDAVELSSGIGTIAVDMIDTTLEAGRHTFSSVMNGNGTHRINLGTGVVAMDNGGTLLNVDRDVAGHAGTVQFNIINNNDGELTGAILDNATSLADLVGGGGGTYLNLSNANYSGNVQNVREVRLENGAHIGGGTTATPNTVLEDVRVESNATFGGNWDIGGTLHAANGRIAPGNSIGVTTANAINWGPGSILEIEVNAAGESDRVDVTGGAPAYVGDTALHVKPESGDGDYQLNHDYRVMNAAGGIDGQFTEASWKGNELIYVNTLYGANQIDISLSVNQFALGAADLTANQRAVSGGALSVAGMNGAADAAFLSANPAASFDLLSGEIHPSTRAGLMHSNTLVSNAILGRMRDRTAAPAGATDGKAPAAANQHPLWVSYTHNQQTAKGDSANTAKRKHKIDSFTLGADAQVGADWHVGGAFAYTNSDVRLNARNSSADIDSYGLAAYAGKSWGTNSGTLNFMAGLGHTWHNIDTQRNVELGGSQALKAGYDARTLHLFGELSHTLPLNEQSAVEPYFGVSWLQHRTDSFTESGGAAALKGASGTDDIGFSTLGVRGSTLVEAGSSKVNLRAGLGWRHAFGDHQPGTSLSFAQGNSSAFTVVGAPIARNTAVFDVGAEVQVGRNTSIGLRYEGQTGSSFTQHAGNLYLKTRF